MESNITYRNNKYVGLQLTDPRENRGDVYFAIDHENNYIKGMKLIRKNLKPNMSCPQELQLFLYYENIPSNNNFLNWHFYIDNTTSNRATAIKIEKYNWLTFENQLIIIQQKQPFILSRILSDDKQLGLKIYKNSRPIKIIDNEDPMEQTEPTAKLLFSISAGYISKTELALGEETGQKISKVYYTPDNGTDTLYKIDIYTTNDKDGFEKLRSIRCV